MRPRVRPFIFTIIMLSTVLAAARLSHGQAQTVRSGETEIDAHGSTDIASLRRMVRHFDFEEAQTLAYVMPINFFRPDPTRGGFPVFGSMQLTDEVAHTGNWSFEFELDGESLSARVPSGVLPAVPYADYLITAMVRTEALQRSRVRISAWLYNAQGSRLPHSVVLSPLVRSEGVWQELSIIVRGDWAEAADLGIELQLLQPRQFRNSSAEPHVPELNDVTGRAWFDDVRIWHLPRIELWTNSPGNVTARDEKREINVLVRDFAGRHTASRLHVYDIDGECVYDSRFTPPQASRVRSFSLPHLNFGWYRAMLDVENAGQLSARQFLDFVVLAPVRRPSAILDNSFGIVIPETPDDRLPGLAPLIARLNVGATVIPIWEMYKEGPLAESAGRQAESPLRQLIDALVDRNLTLTFSLDAIPAKLAQDALLDRRQVIELLSRDSSIWRDALDPFLISFGLEVGRWQIGETGSVDAASHADLAGGVARIRESLDKPLLDPRIVLPWDVQLEPPPPLAATAFNLFVPYHVEPSAIPAYLDAWRMEDRELMVTLQTLPAHQYSQRERLSDLAIRTLELWRADERDVSIAAPWHWEAQRPGQFMPDALYGTWRQLAIMLSGRRIVDTLHIAEGVHCWILESEQSDDHALVVWADRIASYDSLTISLLLSDRSVQVSDLFGNERIAERVDNRHLIELGTSPMFIESIDLALAKFRAGFSIRPVFVPAMHRVHEHEIVLSNPWSTPITGTVRLVDSEDWHIKPRHHEFSLQPGETARLPISIMFDRSPLAGMRRVNAEVLVNAEHQYELKVVSDLEVGLRNIGLSTSWRIAENLATGEDDLVITAFITNKGDRVMELGVSVYAPGIPTPYRRNIILEPGTFGSQTFTIPDGRERLSGRKVRVGVGESDGVARLNRLIDLPRLTRDASIASEQPTAAE